MGRDKAQLRLDGDSLIDRTIRELRRLTADVLVVGRADLSTVGARFLADTRPGLGPVGGLMTGLSAARFPLCIVVACDHPFLRAGALAALAERARGYDAVVPRIEDHAQPTHAVYARTIVTAVERYLDEGGGSMSNLLSLLRVRWVDGPEMDGIDPGRRSLLNVNTPEEWERAVSTSRRRRHS